MLLHTIAHNTLQEAHNIVQLIDDNLYTRISTVVPGSTIGQHVRHVCDHFRLFFSALEKLDNSNVVDFDARSRNNPMEKDRTLAGESITQLQSLITTYEHVPLDAPVCLSAIIDPNQSNSYTFTSSVGRELWYCCIHAVHHFASIKAICVEHGIAVPQSFGVAPSTLKHLQSPSTA